MADTSPIPNSYIFLYVYYSYIFNLCTIIIVNLLQTNLAPGGITFYDIIHLVLNLQYGSYMGHIWVVSSEFQKMILGTQPRVRSSWWPCAVPSAPWPRSCCASRAAPWPGKPGGVIAPCRWPFSGATMKKLQFLGEVGKYIYKLTRIYRVLYGLVWICGKYIEISWNITIVHASKKHDWGHLVVLGSTRWAPVFGRQTSVCEELETPWATSIILIIIIIIINCWSAFKSPAYHGCHDSPPVRSFQVADP